MEGKNQKDGKNNRRKKEQRQKRKKNEKGKEDRHQKRKTERQTGPAVLTSDLQADADSVQVQRLLLDEAPVALLPQASHLQPLEDAGLVEDVLGQVVAVTPHDVKQAHPGDEV